MSLAPHRVVGHSPYHPLKATHPPMPSPASRQVDDDIAGGAAVVAYVVMLLFGFSLGYLAGRLNLLMAVLRLAGVEPQS